MLDKIRGNISLTLFQYHLIWSESLKYADIIGRVVPDTDLAGYPAAG